MSRYPERGLVSAAAHGRLPVGLFSLALASGAWLIFWAEPLVTKSLLPILGGGPAIWTTALMFFQAVLLAGYGFAFLVGRLGRPAVQGAVMVAVMAAAALVLPLRAAAIDGVSPTDHPVGYLLLSLAATAALPLFALSALSPLLQAWFSRSGHREAGDPYFLYAANNMGSLGALLAFPFLLEPALTLRQQGLAWSGLFLLQIVLVAGCCWLASRGGAAVPAAAAAPRPLGRWRWLALAAVPSSLLSGATTVVTTEIASAPLLWTIPLALYLLTYVIAFARRQVLPQRLVELGLPLALAPVIAHQFGAALGPPAISILFHYIAFFLAALACHQQLAAGRPGTERLTEYYLLIAIGGLAGGAFNALIAPLLFTGVHEFAVAMVAAVALRRPPAGPRLIRGDVLWPLAILAAVLVIVALAGGTGGGAVAVVVIIAAGAALLAARPWRFAGVLAVGAVVAALGPGQPGVVHAERNFFGVLRVRQVDEDPATVLIHGITLHGIQRRDAARRQEPLAYYWREGPLGQIFASLDARLSDGSVGIVGLGTGAVACYARPGQRWTLYELDPAVVALATGPHFSYLRDCLPRADIVIGDARVTLSGDRRRFDLLVLDAFSSDSIPVHLLTREAFAMYLDRLAPGGVIAIHISNRYMDLRPVLAAAARHLGLEARHRRAAPEGDPYKLRTDWVALWRAGEAGPAGLGAWEGIGEPGGGLWTDDYSNLLAVLRFW